MATSRVPTNAVDHVGSLKRPPELVQAWRACEDGKLSSEQLRRVQDESIRDAVAMQEKLGLPIVTDGEFRRGGWSRGFLNAVDGFEFRGSKLVFRNDEERARATRLGITDFKRKYSLYDLAGGDVVFAATGVTDGSMLDGVHWHGEFVTTSSILMRSGTRTVRWIKARHRRGHGG